MAGKTPYRILANKDSSIEIEMYGEVVESIPVDFWTGEKIDGLFICLQDFLEDIKGIKDNQRVTVRINSPGGDLEAGIAIYNRLKAIKDLTTIVDGLAASAASLIAQAGKRRCVYQNSEVMIHGASMLLFDFYNLEALKDAAKQLESANEQVIQTYCERTGRDRVKVKHMVENTTWMTGQEIVDEGFADEVIPSCLQMSMNDRYVLSNSLWMDRRLFRQAPPITGKITETEGNAHPVKEAKSMTLDELRAQEPDLVKQIEDDTRASIPPVNTADIEARAMAAERERIKAIESIEASIADKALISKAKFDEPMEAKDLAFIALQKQANLGNVMIQNLQDDTKDSGALDVKTDPVSDEDEKKIRDAADLKEAAKALFGKEV